MVDLKTKCEKLYKNFIPIRNKEIGIWIEKPLDTQQLLLNILQNIINRKKF